MLGRLLVLLAAALQSAAQDGVTPVVDLDKGTIGTPGGHGSYGHALGANLLTNLGNGAADSAFDQEDDPEDDDENDPTVRQLPPAAPADPSPSLLFQPCIPAPLVVPPALPAPCPAHSQSGQPSPQYLNDCSPIRHTSLRSPTRRHPSRAWALPTTGRRRAPSPSSTMRTLASSTSTSSRPARGLRRRYRPSLSMKVGPPTPPTVATLPPPPPLPRCRPGHRVPYRRHPHRPCRGDLPNGDRQVQPRCRPGWRGWSLRKRLRRLRWRGWSLRRRGWSLRVRGRCHSGRCRSGRRRG